MKARVASYGINEQDIAVFSLYGINFGKTTANGAPVKREVEALYDLEDAGIPMWFIGYDKKEK